MVVIFELNCKFTASLLSTLGKDSLVIAPFVVVFIDGLNYYIRYLGWKFCCRAFSLLTQNMIDIQCDTTHCLLNARNSQHEQQQTVT
jgi:hypothetical protein